MSQEQSSIRVQDLEILLEFLPEPTYVHVNVYGITDLTAVSQQMAGNRQGTYIGEQTFNDVSIKEPTKEKIIAIARHQEKRRNLTQLHPVNQDILSRGMQLQRAIWHIGTKGAFMTAGCSLFAEYQGELPELVAAEPAYLKAMRERLPFLPYTIYVNQSMPHELLAH